MTTDEKPTGSEKKSKPESHKVFWIIAAVFILGSIVGMFTLDYIFAPKVPTAAPGAPNF